MKSVKHTTTVRPSHYKSGITVVLSTAAILSTVLLGSSSALAAGAPIRIGETELVPELRLEYFGDSNVFRTNFDETDATGVRAKPRLTWIADKGVTEFKASYVGNYSTSGN